MTCSAAVVACADSYDGKSVLVPMMQQLNYSHARKTISHGKKPDLEVKHCSQRYGERNDRHATSRERLKTDNRMRACSFFGHGAALHEQQQDITGYDVIHLSGI